MATAAQPPESRRPDGKPPDDLPVELAVVDGELEERWDEARCRTGNGQLAGIFFSDDLGDIARARDICSACPVMVPCLEGAVARHEPWGVWGGQLFSGGRILVGKRRPGRPSAVPRPGDQIAEIPVPVHLQGYVRSA
jgi:WhiB family transcriptional regulator, redox-sensing transcriptional regulator